LLPGGQTQPLRDLSKIKKGLEEIKACKSASFRVLHKKEGRKKPHNRIIPNNAGLKSNRFLIFKNK
jgi:hypothetical protein